MKSDPHGITSCHESQYDDHVMSLGRMIFVHAKDLGCLGTENLRDIASARWYLANLPFFLAFDRTSTFLLGLTKPGNDGQDLRFGR